MNMYKFWGKVKKGKNRGKNLGFPTANVSLHKNIPEGVYISQIKFGSKKYSSLTFIGSAKTFNEKEYLSESYMLNFNQDLYDKWISIRLVKKIRPNKKFKSEKELIKQMKKDEINAREYFSQERT